MHNEGKFKAGHRARKLYTFYISTHTTPDSIEVRQGGATWEIRKVIPTWIIPNYISFLPSLYQLVILWTWHTSNHIDS